MWAWCATLAARRRDPLHSLPRRRRLALWETLAVAGDRVSSRSAFSLYVVDVLEILKSSNPRRFRLGRRHDELDERRSA